jgi:hypothetical protein
MAINVRVLTENGLNVDLLQPQSLDIDLGYSAPATFRWLYIRYADDMPTADSDIKTVPSAYIGIAVNSSGEAPTDHTAYQWYKWKGEQGIQGVGIDDIDERAESDAGITYRILLTDHTYYDILAPRGPQGPQGEPADESDLVHINGAETITGDKTFTGIVAVPTPSDGTHAVTKSYVDTTVGNIDVLLQTI